MGFREVETKENAELEAQQKLMEGNPWKAVALLLDLNGEAAAEGKSISGQIKSPRTSSVVQELSTPRTQDQSKQQQRSRDISPKPPKKKTADLSRMREVRNPKPRVIPTSLSGHNV